MKPIFLAGHKISQLKPIAHQVAKDHGELTPEGLKINIILSYQELANLVNASRVMVTNVLNELKHEGVIMINQRMFYLVDNM
ncbi:MULTISPECIES: helix-turn-helix domain-containing protein [Dehalobacter]|uniref:helix-turn-helix domain-containing protein n=1 Tax=Dehalobacter TaxID=56112 RepID=UPI0009D93DF3